MEKSLMPSSAISAQACKSLAVTEASKPALGVAICQFSKKQIDVQCALFFIFLREEGRTICGFGAGISLWILSYQCIYWHLGMFLWNGDDIVNIGISSLEIASSRSPPSPHPLPSHPKRAGFVQNLLVSTHCSVFNLWEKFCVPPWRLIAVLISAFQGVPLPFAGLPLWGDCTPKWSMPQPVRAGAHTEKSFLLGQARGCTWLYWEWEGSSLGAGDSGYGLIAEQYRRNCWAKIGVNASCTDGAKLPPPANAMHLRSIWPMPWVMLPWKRRQPQGGDSSAAGYEWDPTQLCAEQMPAGRMWIHLQHAI